MAPVTAQAAISAQAADPLAVAFGKLPEVWGLSLSPDGSQISYLRMVDGHIPFLHVLDADGRVTPALPSVVGKYNLTWCRWANNDRLLCGLAGNVGEGSELHPVTRLVAVNADGTGARLLMQDELRRSSAQFHDQIIDWLPEDPEHVLIEMPSDDFSGVSRLNSSTINLTGRSSGVSRLNIHTGETSIEIRQNIGARHWMSDGRGTVRLKLHINRKKVKWTYRLADSKKWRTLYERKTRDVADYYYPVGFGSARNKLLVLKPHEGRIALWEDDLETKNESRLVFSHQQVDVRGYSTLGKYNRLVAASYTLDKSYAEFFDQKVKSIYERVRRIFPDQKIGVLDESWDQRFYLVSVSSDQNPGTYYLFDTRENNLELLWRRRPGLDDHELSAMNPIRYPARDGTEIPGYLTLPAGADGAELPAIVLPHGGPGSRDVWGFHWLAQYLAAKGYAVLQSNFRGSGGYGETWEGEGGFRAWRRTIDDLTDGARMLVDKGIADPNRICIIGWSYGGYAALMSAIEEPETYKCVVSIAGVTDPMSLIRERIRFSGAAGVKQFIGTDDETIKHGSPLNRANEVRAPVLMFHGDKDINVAMNHSKKMQRALESNDVPSELVIYKDTAHSIRRDDYRIDMLSKLGLFLDQHIGTAMPELVETESAL